MDNLDNLFQYVHVLHKLRCSLLPDTKGKDVLFNEAVRIKEKILFELSLRQTDEKDQ